MALYTVQPNSVVNAADVNQFTNLLNGTTSGVQITNAGRIRAQATGATTGTGGYVGEGPALSAPTSGTFVAGDFVSDGTGGMIWVCTAGGTPGTWSTGPTRIGTTTLGSTTASVTFSSIPAFTRIVLCYRVRSSASGLVDIQMRIDGNSGSNYLWTKMEEDSGASNPSHSAGAVTFAKVGVADGNTASYFASGTMTLEGWNTATGFMTFSGAFGGFSTSTVDWAGSAAGQFNVVGPHTSITLLLSSNSFAAGSTFSIYGMM
jgi:hypothetical protein